MAEPTPSTETSKIDLYEFLKIKLNPDGSFTRLVEFPNVPPSPTPSEPPQHALSKDLPLNPKTKTSFRLFLPHPPSSSSTKLPFIIYFHGEGFIHFRHSSLIFHEFCTTLAAHLPALVLSLDYRLSPEHRLLAAYDAIEWIRTQALDPTQSDLWISDHADFSKCFRTSECLKRHVYSSFYLGVIAASKSLKQEWGVGYLQRDFNAQVR